MKAIVAISENHMIGNSQSKWGIPWECEDDMNYFNEQTSNKVCLCGYKTFEMLPQSAVDNREYVIDMHSHRFPTKVLESIEWVIGGKRTYEKYWDDIDEFHVTLIDGSYEGDCKWPTLFSRLRSDFMIESSVIKDHCTIIIYKRR